MNTVDFPKMNRLKNVTAVREHLQSIGWELPLDETILSAEEGSPLAESWQAGQTTIGNRWCIHPMEGWDAKEDGSPSELTLRRWKHFGLSGAKLIWGGEAAAVHPDGRANPNQTLATADNKEGLSQLLITLLDAHSSQFQTTEDLLVGLQLTHSGRFCKPNEKFTAEPRIAYHHPLLDEKFHIATEDESLVWTDTELEDLIDCYVAASQLAAEIGFKFVDIKACHGYLLHEFLSARVRSGEYGGEFSGRIHLLRTIIASVREACPDLMIGVRLSAFDIVPFRTSTEVGQPMDYQPHLPYQYGFGVNPDNPLEMDLTETIQLLKILRDDGVAMLNLSCGSPYYNPHIQRPAAFPPSDGYQPPEDPLIGVCRQIHAVRECKQAVPDLPLVGSGYSYLQDYLPHVAQAVVRAGWVDSVGLGRMVLSYPELPADTLRGTAWQRKKVCRTFSDCTTGPRNGLISGCYPLDPFYKKLPEADELKQVKQDLKQNSSD